jgi:predicted lactoylglutathione lyase
MQGEDKLEVTEEEAVIWIKDHNKDINPSEWRVRFYEKLGIERQPPESEETDTSLQQEDQFENDNYYINFFSQRTSQNIRNRYLSKLMIDTKEERPRKKNQHSK